MKSISDLIHKTPWWALVAGGFVVLAALALFVTPTHLIRLEKSGATPEENKAIKREIEYAFTEGAIDFARGVVREMQERATDPARKDELAHAIEELDNARDGLREAGREVLRAKREALDAAVDAAKEARAAIAVARKDAARALKEAGVENDRITKSLDESLQAAKNAEAEAKRALDESKKERRVDKVEAAPSVPKVTVEKSADGQKKRVIIGGLGSDKPFLDIEVDRGSHKGARIQIDPPSPPAAPLPPLTPEAKADIRQKVTGDLYRIGIGSGLILIFIPLFILTLIAKIFIDRARASMRLASVL